MERRKAEEKQRDLLPEVSQIPKAPQRRKAEEKQKDLLPEVSQIPKAPQKRKAGKRDHKVNVAEFAIMKVDPRELTIALEENLGGKLDAFALDRIAVPTGGGLKWTIPTLLGEEDTEAIEGIIVYWHDIRIFWRDPYAGQNKPPDCLSNDCEHGYGDPGGECIRCPYAQWGSAEELKGITTRGQACKQCRRLFIFRSDNRLPILLTLPPTSLVPVRKYFQRLASHAMPYYSVVTRIELERDKSDTGITYSKVNPTMVQPLTDDQRARFRSLSELFRPKLQAVRPDAKDYPTTEPSKD